MTVNRDSALFVGYALASAGLSVAAAHGLVSTGDAVEVTGVLAAFATAYHIPNARASAALKEANSGAPDLPSVEIPEEARHADVTAG